MIHAFRTFIIRIDGTGGFNHGPQTFRIFQHGAGAKHIIIERLILMVSHEDGASQGVQQGNFVNIDIGIMDKYARLYIALGVDM